MTAPAETAAEAANDDTAVAVPVSDNMVQAFGAMMALIPESTGDGMENVLRQIAQATSAAQLDSPWESAGLDAVIGRRIRIDGARRLPSDFQDGLGWFLVLDVVDLGTGEASTVTTGAVSVVAQIAKAYALGAIPLTCIPREAKRASAAGFYPLHLEIVE